MKAIEVNYTELKMKIIEVNYTELRLILGEEDTNNSGIKLGQSIIVRGNVGEPDTCYRLIAMPLITY